MPQKVDTVNKSWAHLLTNLNFELYLRISILKYKNN